MSEIDPERKIVIDSLTKSPRDQQNTQGEPISTWGKYINKNRTRMTRRKFLGSALTGASLAGIGLMAADAIGLTSISKKLGSKTKK